MFVLSLFRAKDNTQALFSPCPWDLGCRALWMSEQGQCLILPCAFSSGNRRSSPPACGFRLSPEEEMRRQRLHRFDSQRGNPALWTNTVRLCNNYPQTLSFAQKQRGHMTIPVAHLCSGLSSCSHHESNWCFELVDILRPGLFWQPPALWEWHSRPCSLADRSSGVSTWGPVSTLPSLTADSAELLPCYVFEDRDLCQEVCVHQPRRSGPPPAQCPTWQEAGGHPSSSWHIAMVTFQAPDVAVIAGCRPGLPCPDALVPGAPMSERCLQWTCFSLMPLCLPRMCQWKSLSETSDGKPVPHSTTREVAPTTQLLPVPEPLRGRCHILELRLVFN